MWWNNVGPQIAWLLTHIGFIVVPILNIGYFVYQWISSDIMKDEEANICRPWYLTFALIGVCELLGYFFLGRLLIDCTQEFLAADIEEERIRLEKLDDDMLDEDAGFDTSDLTYGEAVRDVGAGPYRIGKPLKGKVNNDLYSMIFVSCFRAAYVLDLKRK